jgi:hypothetical protein
MTHHRLTLAVAFALTVIALASPAANAFSGGPPGPAPVDLRTPDAQDAARPAPVDLRSPDARDAARTPATRGPSYAVMTAPERRTTVHHAGGTDWNDVALIGGGTTAFVLLGLGTAVSVRRRETARRDSVATPR